MMVINRLYLKSQITRTRKSITVYIKRKARCHILKLKDFGEGDRIEKGLVTEIGVPYKVFVCPLMNYLRY
jgi:hypothetical protein